MDKDLQHIEQIERYLEGKLSDKERTMVENRMEKDKNFSQDVATYRFLTEGIDDAEKADFEAKVSRWELQAQQEGTTKEQGTVRTLRTRIRYYAAVAIILLLLIPAGYWFFQPSTLSSEALFAQNFEAYPDIITVKGDNPNNILAEAMAAYNAKNYDKALPLFEQYLATEQNSKKQIQTEFYMGISQLALGKRDTKTVETFKKVIISNDMALTEQAEWYLVLAYIQSEEMESAKAELTNIIGQEGHSYQQKADDLIKKIKL